MKVERMGLERMGPELVGLFFLMDLMSLQSVWRGLRLFQKVRILRL